VIHESGRYLTCMDLPEDTRHSIVRFHGQGKVCKGPAASRARFARKRLVDVTSGHRMSDTLLREWLQLLTGVNQWQPYLFESGRVHALQRFQAVVGRSADSLLSVARLPLLAYLQVAQFYHLTQCPKLCSVCSKAG
jgi:hypothetical protein